MVDYFNELLRTSNVEWEEVVSCIEPKIIDIQTDELLALVENGEVKKALFGIHPDKSSGPDGMSPGFYQRYWSIACGCNACNI